MVEGPRLVIQVKFRDEIAVAQARQLQRQGEGYDHLVSPVKYTITGVHARMGNR